MNNLPLSPSQTVQITFCIKMVYDGKTIYWKLFVVPTQPYTIILSWVIDHLLIYHLIFYHAKLCKSMASCNVSGSSHNSKYTGNMRVDGHNECSFIYLSNNVNRVSFPFEKKYLNVYVHAHKWYNIHTCMLMYYTLFYMYMQ